MGRADDIFIRNIMFYGKEGFNRLQKSFVALVGLGGVGSSAAEALVRGGIGRIRLIDCDVVKPSDMNRQLIALHDNIDRPKVEAAGERLKAINPDLFIDCRHAFFHHDTAGELITPDIDFVIDAIDSLNPKGELIRHCTGLGIRFISALGAAGRADPFRIKIGNLDETSICPLARVLRRHLRTRKISTAFPVIYSVEAPIESHPDAAAPQAESSGTYMRGRVRTSLPSLPAIPAIFGFMAANYVMGELLREE